MSTTEFRSLFPTVISNSSMKDSYLDRVFERLNQFPDSGTLDKYRIHEENSEWKIELPLPGATKEDITISLKEADKLAVEVTSENLWSTGEKRNFKLPTAADVDAITAEMKNGLLEIRIPKKKTFQDRLVKIK